MVSSADKPSLDTRVAGAFDHFPHFPKLPHVSRKGLLYGALAGVAALSLAYFGLRAAGVPLPPGQFRREDGQEQQYQQNSNNPGLPEISQPTPAQTATAMPEPTAEPSPVPTYPVPTATQPPTPTSVPTPPPTYTAVPPTPTATRTPPPTPTATATPRPPTPTPIATFTQEQLKQKLSSLEEILKVEEPVLDAEGRDYKGYAQKVQDVFEAGYYLTTGKTPQQNNIEVKILTKTDYDRFIDENRISADLKSAMGFNYVYSDLKTGEIKRLALVRGDLSVKSALNTAVHEDGHALASSLNPKLKASNLASAALSESQAFTFEAAWNRSVDKFIKEGMLNYSKDDTNIEWITKAVAFYEAAIKQPISRDNYYALGTPLPWLRAREKGMLKLGQQLSAQQTYELFLDLVTTPKDDADAEKFVNNLLAQVNNHDLSFMKENAVSRLVDGYPTDKQGPMHPRIALLTP